MKSETILNSTFNIYSTKITLIHHNHLWYCRVPANSTFCTCKYREFLAMRQCPVIKKPTQDRKSVYAEI